MLSSRKSAISPLPVIRQILPEDATAVSQMAASIWRAHYVPDIVTAEQIEYMLPRVASADIFKAAIANKNQRLWLAELNGQLAGYICIAPRENSDAWFIDKLYVDMNLQRSGIGLALLTHAIDTLRPSALWLRVNRKNYKAINFYFKHGFSIDRVDVLDIGNGFVMDDFIMKKVL